MITYQSDPCDYTILDQDPKPATMALRLCRFDTGHSELLPEHVEALNEEILEPHWRARDGQIKISGFASRLGYAHNPKGNLMLSDARCQAVKDFLEPHLPDGFPFVIKSLDPKGDSDSQNDPDIDAGFHRAVLVELFAHGYTKTYVKQPHPIPRHVLQSPSDLFVFVPVKIFSTSIPFGGVVGSQKDNLLFKLIDTSTGEWRYFLYSSSGSGFNASVSLPGRSSGYDSSDRPTISTAVAVRDLAEFTTVYDPVFARLKSYGVSASTPSGSIGPSTYRFTFRPAIYVARHIDDWITVEFSFSKGTGAGASYAESNGGITLLPKDYTPRPGDVL
jgi:hypothetical protein